MLNTQTNTDLHLDFELAKKQHEQGIPPTLVGFLTTISEKVVKGNVLLRLQDSRESKQHSPVEIYFTSRFGEIELHWISHSNGPNLASFTSETVQEFSFKANHYAKDGKVICPVDTEQAYQALCHFTNWLLELVDKGELTLERQMYSHHVLTVNPGIEVEDKFLIVTFDEYSEDQLDFIRNNKSLHFSNEKAISYFMGNDYRDFICDTVEDLLEALNGKYDEYSYSHFTKITVGKENN